MVLVIHLTAPAVSGWDLVGPLLLAGLGTGMTIAPNQDFVLATVPRQEAGTASRHPRHRAADRHRDRHRGHRHRAVRQPARSRPGRDAVASAFSHSAQLALLANLGFVVVALVLVLALPRQIPQHAGR